MKKNILLLTDCPPSNNYSGALMTNRFLDLIKSEVNLFFFVIIDPKLPNKNFDESFVENSKQIIFKSPEYKVNLAKYYKNKFFCFPKKAEQVIDFINNHKIDIVWSILQGQNIICVTEILQRKIKIPIKVQMWDSLEWWLRERNIKENIQKKYLAIFDKVISKASAIATASQNMTLEYKKKYNKDSEFFLSFQKKENSLCQQNSEQPNELSIGFCGQLYAKNNFISFISALNKIDWKIKEKKIKFKIYTYIDKFHDFRQYLDNIKMPEENIILGGWKNSKELSNNLQNCDALYCPYWFDKEYYLESLTSFPSKLTTYLTTEKPIIMHSPDYASPYVFLKNYNASILCPSLDENKIIDTINQLENKNLINEIIINQNKAYSENLTPEIAKIKLKKFLS